MRIALIGGTGFLGRHLVRELLQQGHSVRLLKHMRGETGGSIPAQEQNGPCQVFRLSMDDQQSLVDALADCHAVAYLSGINREREKGDFHRIHVAWLGNVIAAVKAIAADAQSPSTIPAKIVYTSFLKARPSKYSQYLQSKYDGENLLQASGLDYTILKPGICFGAGDQMIHNIVLGLQLLPAVAVFGAVGIKESTMRPLSAKDMALIMVAALTENRMSKQTIGVVGPEEITLSVAARRVAAVLKKVLLIVHFPEPLMYMLAWTLEKVSANALVTVSQVRMLADGLSTAENAPDSLPPDLQPKTYFREEEIREALAVNQLK
jgi:NADH dehydrogenase